MNGTTRTAAAPRTVIIVGSGPTGLLLAADLATAGVPVTLVEKRPHRISNLSRAFVLHARTLEQLDARGLADELEAQGRSSTASGSSTGSPSNSTPSPPASTTCW